MVVTPEQKKLLKEKFPGRPNEFFSPDEYKIWLADTFEIKKHELFGKYQCNDKLFDTLDEAMSYAEDLDYEIQREERRQWEKEKLKTEIRMEKMKWWVGVILLTYVIMLIFYKT